MSEDNKDHYKFMPPGSVPPPPEAEDEPTLVEEEIVMIQQPAEPETVARMEETVAVAPPFPAETSESRFPLSLKLLYGFFSPLLVPTFVSLFVFLLSVLALIVPEATVPYTLTVFGATCLVPMLAIYVLMKVGALHSLDMENPRERIVPYIIEILALGGCTLFFLFKGANTWIWSLFCGGAAVALVNFIVNFRMRISCHCSAMAALVAAIIVINRSGLPQTSLFWWAVGAVFFAGCVGTIAMTYGKHTIWEVLAGYATGFLGIILFSLIH